MRKQAWDIEVDLMWHYPKVTPVVIIWSWNLIPGSFKTTALYLTVASQGAAGASTGREWWREKLAGTGGGVTGLEAQDPLTAWALMLALPSRNTHESRADSLISSILLNSVWEWDKNITTAYCISQKFLCPTTSLWLKHSLLLLSLLHPVLLTFVELFLEISDVTYCGNMKTMDMAPLSLMDLSSFYHTSWHSFGLDSFTNLVSGLNMSPAHWISLKMRNSGVEPGLLDQAWLHSVCDLFTYLHLDIGTVGVHSFHITWTSVWRVYMGKWGESECLWPALRQIPGAAIQRWLVKRIKIVQQK